MGSWYYPKNRIRQIINLPTHQKSPTNIDRFNYSKFKRYRSANVANNKALKIGSNCCWINSS